jgi:hypothetical protein
VALAAAVGGAAVAAGAAGMRVLAVLAVLAVPVNDVHPCSRIVRSVTSGRVGTARVAAALAAGVGPDVAVVAGLAALGGVSLWAGIRMAVGTAGRSARVVAGPVFTRSVLEQVSQRVPEALATALGAARRDHVQGVSERRVADRPSRDGLGRLTRVVPDG